MLLSPGALPLQTAYVVELEEGPDLWPLDACLFLHCIVSICPVEQTLCSSLSCSDTSLPSPNLHALYPSPLQVPVKEADR